MPTLGHGLSLGPFESGSLGAAEVHEVGKPDVGPLDPEESTGRNYADDGMLRPAAVQRICAAHRSTHSVGWTLGERGFERRRPRCSRSTRSRNLAHASIE